MNRLTLALAVVVALVGASGGGWWLGYGAGIDEAQARHNAALVIAQQSAADETKRLMRAVEQVAADAAEEQEAIKDRLADANTALGRLRNALRDPASGDDTVAAARADAARARSLLAECAERLTGLAEQADRLRATVLGLQAYANSLQD